jgi:hypothetical protein
VSEEGGEQRHPPGAALRGDVADRDGGVHRSGQEALSHAFSLEESAVREHPVQPYALVLQQHIHPDPQGGE